MNDLHKTLSLSALLSLFILAVMIAEGSAFGSWAWPGLLAWIAPQAWLPALLTIAALAVALPRLARPGRPRSYHGAIVVLLAGLFFCVRWDAPVGDWQVIIWCAETWQPLGKWYGSALAYGLVHHLVGAPFGLSASTSVALFSACCGAMQAWIAARIAARLELGERFPAWRWLYIGSFGLVAMGLGHREIYPLVSLLTAWVAYRLVLLTEGPEWTRAAQLGLALAAALSAYVGGLLLLPVWVVALTWWIARVRRGTADGIGAWLLAGLPVALPGLLITLGPEAQRHTLGSIWSSQLGRGVEMNAKAIPPFLPADVHWSWFTNLIAPTHWFSDWHLLDMLGVIASSQSLALCFVAIALIPAWLASRGERRAVLLLLCVLALPQSGYALLVVHGLPYPWDWDLPAHALGAVVWCALGCCTASEAGPLRVASSRAIFPAAAAIATVLAGAALLCSTTVPPAEAGPTSGALRMAVGPAPLIGNGGQLIWLWLRNEGPREIAWAGTEYSVALIGERDGVHFRSALDRHTLLSGQRLRAGRTTPFTSFFWQPERFEAVDLKDDPTGAAWKPIELSRLSGSFTARWLVSFPRGPAEPPAQLISAPLTWKPHPE